MSKSSSTDRYRPVSLQGASEPPQPVRLELTGALAADSHQVAVFGRESQLLVAQPEPQLKHPVSRLWQLVHAMCEQFRQCHPVEGFIWPLELTGEALGRAVPWR